MTDRQRVPAQPSPASDERVTASWRANLRDTATQIESPPEHAGAGAFLGGILGGILGWLIGVGAVPPPALLPFNQAKPLLLALALAAFGAIIGGVTGAIADSGAAAEDASAAHAGSADNTAHRDEAREGRRE